MTESQLVNGVLSALSLKGAEAWRNNAHLTVIQAVSGRRVIRGGPKGSADIFVVIPPRGRFGVMECKTQIGKLTDAQKRWLAKMEKLGARTAVVRTIGEAVAAYFDWVRDEQRERDVRMRPPDNGNGATGPADQPGAGDGRLLGVLARVDPGGAADPEARASHTDLRQHFRAASAILQKKGEVK
jgi:hypothetical protein